MLTISKAFLVIWGLGHKKVWASETKLETIRAIPRDFAEMSRLVLSSGIYQQPLLIIV